MCNTSTIIAGLLPESLPAGQVIPRPQNALLRCGAVHVLHPDGGGPQWLSSGRIFLQGEQRCFKIKILKEKPIALIFAGLLENLENVESLAVMVV